VNLSDTIITMNSVQFTSNLATFDVAGVGLIVEMAVLVDLG